MGAAVTSGRAEREGEAERREAERREAERREAERGRGGAGRGGGRGDAGACGLGVVEMERGDRGEGQLREASGVRKVRGGRDGGQAWEGHGMGGWEAGGEAKAREEKGRSEGRGGEGRGAEGRGGEVWGREGRGREAKPKRQTQLTTGVDACSWWGEEHWSRLKNTQSRHAHQVVTPVAVLLVELLRSHCCTPTR
ncbi:unnamed protein product, partial [Closterium sp. Naga37s-1]